MLWWYPWRELLARLLGSALLVATNVDDGEIRVTN